MRLFRLVALGLALSSCPAAAAQPEEARRQWVKVSEGTRFAARMFPDGGSLLLDLQNGLWRLPRAGGRARRLSVGNLALTEPDISPDGRTLVVEGHGIRGAGIYLLDARGGVPRSLSPSSGEETQPRWSPDGRAIAFVSTRSGRAEIWLHDRATGSDRKLTDLPGAKRSLSWSPDGTRIGFVADGKRVLAVARTGGAAEPLLDIASGLSAASLGLDDRIAYVAGGRLFVQEGERSRLVGGFDDVFDFAPQWLAGGALLYTANGKIRVSEPNGATRTVPMSARFRFDRPAYPRKRHDFAAAKAPVKGIVAPALSPDGTQLVFRALNDLWLLPATGGQARRITEDAAFENDPAWAPDGKSVVFAASRGGRFALVRLDLASGRRTQLGGGEGMKQRPAWSPDGRTIAYQDAQERIWLLDLASGTARKLHDIRPGSGRLSWSPDGRTLIAATLADNRNGYLAIDVASGAARQHQVAPERSIATRQDNGPWWSPDGRALLFSMESTLWTMPVDAQGAPAGPPRQITRELSDAPSWGAGGRTILYLAGGKLRLIDRDGGNARTLDHGLEWTRAAPAEALLIQPGAVWDGVHPEPRRDTDVLVRGGRIVAIGPRGTLEAAGVRVLAAPDLTLTPGLIDMHVHLGPNLMQMGDGQGPLFLSFGITTQRSTGDYSYRNLEVKEAVAAGASIGPRLFSTGEYLEGSRFSWPESRPVESLAQLDLEIARARALDYDLIKAYYHLPAAWQRAAMEKAHRAPGIPLTSHYLYPNVAHGMDGVEHLGGPTHWGMDRNFLKSNDNLYDDVIQGIVRSGIVVTTTNFESAIGLRDDPGLVEDPRVAAFYQPEMRTALRGKLACAQGRGPCGFLGPNEAASRRNAEALVLLASRGANIVAGTDAPLDSPAISLHMNLRALQAAGMRPFDVLRSATAKAAEALNVAGDLGTVEVGKLADLILVAGDPSRDVKALAEVRYTLAGGRLWSREALLAPR